MLVVNSFRILIFALTIIVFSSCKPEDQETTGSLVESPNIVLIMTDDQGIGDFGFMGNPYIKTANLDKLASESLNLTNFYVSPVCAPTRASLMTGRYSERTGIYDTFNGGAIMSEDEVTIAEVLKEHGYRTGIFGKWHLGDNYPSRPIDQGFDEVLVHRGGGMGQPGDYLNFFAKDSSYFDPVLFHNGQAEQTKGYCSDIFTDGAIEFIKHHNSSGAEQPFFVYLPFNAPHTPLQLPQNYYNMYKDLEFDADAFPIKPNAVPRMTEADNEAARRVYGMVTNIDDNIGRLMEVLKKENLEQNTIVVFLSDNGPQQVRYKLGLRKRKSSVYSGGVRVPCLIHYPAKYPGKQNLDIPLAHIDLLPSLLDLCGINQPDHEIDGSSFVGERASNVFLDRTLFFEWGRGFLVKYRNFAALKGDYKLVGNTGADSELSDFELYHLKSDPYEERNRVEEDAIIASELKRGMDAWYEEIISAPNNNRFLPAFIGSEYENPTVLNRNDAKGTPVAWRQEDALGYWDVKVVETANYDVTLHFIEPISAPGNVHLKLYPQNFIQRNATKADQLKIENIELKQGEFKLETYYRTNKGEYIFPLYVSIKRLN
jgi:arylsulfatase A-like enzyme